MKTSIIQTGKSHVEAAIEVSAVALQVVQWLARYKTRQLAKSGAVKAVVQALCRLCAEPDPPEHDEADQLPIAKIAAQVSRSLTCNLIPSSSSLLNWRKCPVVR